NVRIVPFAPQLTILKKAAVAIIHGGAGAVRECIRFQVPMLVFPATWDQPGNAARVAHHELGLVGQVENIPQQLRTLLSETRFRNALVRMSAQARDEWSRGEALQVIEQMANTRPQSPSLPDSPVP